MELVVGIKSVMDFIISRDTTFHYHHGIYNMEGMVMLLFIYTWLLAGIVAALTVAIYDSTYQLTALDLSKWIVIICGGYITYIFTTIMYIIYRIKNREW